MAADVRATENNEVVRADPWFSEVLRARTGVYELLHSLKKHSAFLT